MIRISLNILIIFDYFYSFLCHRTCNGNIETFCCSLSNGESLNIATIGWPYLGDFFYQYSIIYTMIGAIALLLNIRHQVCFIISSYQDISKSFHLDCVLHWWKREKERESELEEKLYVSNAFCEIAQTDTGDNSQQIDRLHP